ncbi:MAG: DUF309 domain-containing protein [Terriglobales bacterium]
MHDRFAIAVELFNAERYFEAHEAWEDEWRDSADPERRWLQGLIQAAVALHHRSRGNYPGATSVMARAIVNLRTCPHIMRGIDVVRFREELEIALADMRAENVGIKVTVRRAG